MADNGLKAFTFSFIVKTKTPIVFECHGSKFIEEKEQKNDLLSKFVQKLKYQFKDFGAQKFTKIVVLSSENLKKLQP